MPSNLLFIMSDEHNPRILGAAGNPIIHSPNLDRLAARGLSFTDAVCNSPICVPSRASFATGRYVHEIGYWDNAHPYEGRVTGWGHRLIANGHQVISIGKLHYRREGDPNGFSREVMPLHVVDGIGDVLGSVRPDLPVRESVRDLADELGPGESSYAKYDRDITDAAIAWLNRDAPRYRDKPWVLFVSLVEPHFPLVALPEFYELYAKTKFPTPAMYATGERPDHPFIQAMRRCMNYDSYFTPETMQRALANYYGMVSHLDHLIGRILAALDSSGLAGNTRVIYTSDHGDNLGTRGLWGKSTMFKESVGVPLIMAGPGVPQGVTCDRPVSLVDCHQTILQTAGLELTAEDRERPGRCLLDIARGDIGERVVLSEYHAVGALTGSFMIRTGRWKYVHYVDMPPMLFDVIADPEERHDLGRDPRHAADVASCEKALRSVVDPEAVSARALRDQAAKIAAYGGRDAVIRRGTFGRSPIPGEAPVYR
ncbi:MAG: sulfatase [Alphaproteobacteria bacterium]|nr:sulfatase [Alphaproteobacteria bacterium]